jgi:predicted component of type VI protein secretion system
VSKGALGSKALIGWIMTNSPTPTMRNAYLIVDGMTVYPLWRAITNIGRRPDNDIVLDDPRVSRRHARVLQEGDGFTIVDMDSTGGTFVNGARVQTLPLHPGDSISLAGVAMVFGLETDHKPSDEPAMGGGESATMIAPPTAGLSGQMEP